MDPSVLRILDANVNRTRESLRVIEEYARFVLDDAALLASAKQLRHDLRQALAWVPRASLLAARDTVADVGTAVTTEAERRRQVPADVATAACKRLAEGLRSLAEYAKLADTEAAARLEAIRYRAYELEKQLGLRIHLGAHVERIRLYVLITAELCSGGWLETAQAAIDGGADCLQLREPNFSDAELLSRAGALRDLCRVCGTFFVVNNRPDIARLVAADGVHLGQGDLPVRAARRIAGPDCAIGVSTHTIDQLKDAIAAGPDYVAVGPMFASSTKPRDLIAGPPLLAEAVKLTSLPVVPVGGITADNANTLIAAGARRVAVCAGVIAQSDPRAAAAALRERLDRATTPGP